MTLNKNKKIIIECGYRLLVIDTFYDLSFNVTSKPCLELVVDSNSKRYTLSFLTCKAKYNNNNTSYYYNTTNDIIVHFGENIKTFKKGTDITDIQKYILELCIYLTKNYS